MADEEKVLKGVSKEDIGNFFSETGGKLTMRGDGTVEIQRNPKYTDLSLESPSITIRLIGSEGSFKEKIAAAKELMDKAIKVNKTIKFVAPIDTGVPMVA